MDMAVTSSGHVLSIVEALLSLGWRFDIVPEKAKLRRNGLLVRLKSGKDHRQFRLFVYKITGSGRNQHERRIEITTTYSKGLEPAAGYQDVVLGYDPAKSVYVGIEPRRIQYGGPTGNASSFIDPGGLEAAEEAKIMILRRQSQIFGIEHQAYFKGERLSEYLFNTADIHRGVYSGRGEFSGNRFVENPGELTVPAERCAGKKLVMDAPKSAVIRKQLRKEALSALETEDVSKLRKLAISQEEFLALAKVRQEIGLKGEEFVLKYEQRRLVRAGKKGLAAQVSWISQTRPFEGYDILSYEVNGEERCIEVKATSGHARLFPITENEWQVAGARGGEYFIYRVTAIYTGPRIRILQDPVDLAKAGTIKRCPLAWTIEY